MTARTQREIKRPKNPRKSARAQAGNAAARRSIVDLSEYSKTSGRAILLHGHTDAGKTVCAIHKAPRPLLVLDCDTGLESIFGTTRPSDVHVWAPREEGTDLDWEQMDEFRDYVKSGDWILPYKTIVVDNVTAGQKPVIVHSLQEAISKLPEEKRANRDPDIPSQQDWGKIYRIYDRWIRDIRNAKRRGVNVVFTCGTREWLDEVEGYAKLMPNLEGAIRNQIATHMDVVGYMESDEDGRRLILGPSGATITKVRLPVQRHNQRPDMIESPDFPKMIKAVEVINADDTARPKKKTTTKRRTKK